MERNEFLGKRVELLPHKELCEDYYRLTGTIIRYRFERRVPIDKNSEAFLRAKVEESWQVRFDHELTSPVAKKIENWKLCKTLRVCRDMFEVIGDSVDEDLHVNVNVITNEEQSIV
jgi:hypothetical protein